MVTPKDDLLRVENHRSGIFKFQAGINTAALQPLLDKIEEAHRRISGMPVLPDVAIKLEREILVDSVYGTNAIENGELTEEETAAALDAPPEQAREESTLRVVNIRKAYDIAERYGESWRTNIKNESYPHLILEEKMFTDLIHYYFERIHPFWDGNGRVGRVIETMILKAAGYKYVPFALSHYYLEHIGQYFSLFNQARKAEEKGTDNPNQEFVAFFLEGALTVFNQLHDRINQIIGYLLYRSRLRDLYEQKAINNRQYLIINTLLQASPIHTLSDLQSQLWYNSLYEKFTAKTRARDMKGLFEQQLIRYMGNGENKKIVLSIPGMQE